MAKKYYAVKKGYHTGIFETWEECKKETQRFSGAVYKSFTSLEDAKSFIRDDDSSASFDDMVCAVAYVDGSYCHDTKRFSYGAVIFYNGKTYKFNECFYDQDLSKMRNVAGEIKGAEKAMRFCIENNIKNLDLFYDYEGIEKWCTGIWRTNKKGTISYKQYFDSIKDDVNVRFNKVKGHSGDQFNDMADRLAKDALGLK